MLQLSNISKSFIQRGIVLDNLSLEIRKGDSVAVTGPSGSGKTTLLNIIGLLDKPDDGDISFNGNHIGNLDPVRAAYYRNVNIGFVFQDHLLLPHLTIRDNILLPVHAVKRTRKELEEAGNRAAELMRVTGIEQLAGKYPFLVSGGEAQRAALVRALINQPSLLLADEPTGSLDADNANIMSDLLIRMNREHGVTLLIATHSMILAGRMSARYSLDRGKLKSW